LVYIETRLKCADEYVFCTKAVISSVRSQEHRNDSTAQDKENSNYIHLKNRNSKYFVYLSF